MGLSLWQRYQSFLDSSIVYPKARWWCFVTGLVFYFWRIFLIGGFYVVTYALCIFLLNLSLRFLTPIMSDLEDDDEDNPVLPMRENDEFKPMLRKLGEFKFWRAATLALLVAFGCTFVSALDLPVFWPVLVMYFVILFVATMKRQIAHMIKHNYNPLDFIRKPTYRKKNTS
jgi:hypothetical protein